MNDYSRRRFLKMSSAVIAGAGLTSPLLMLGGCDTVPTDGFREREVPERNDRNAPVGHWEAMQNVPVRAWSAALLPTGKVLLFQDAVQMFLWDPDGMDFTQLAPANTNLFCAGLAMLADGRLLAAGGHEDYVDDHFLGINTAEVFDPWQERWEFLPDMAGGERWYPTAVTLADGRVLVASGTHAGETNESIEIFDPAEEQWTEIAHRPLPLYPWSATRPGSELVFYGPMAQSLNFNWENGTFRGGAGMNINRWGGSGALLNARTGKLLAVGGGDPTSATAEVFDPETGFWNTIASMAHPRHYPDLVLMPDGTVMVVGGHSTSETEHEGDLMRAGILDLNRNRWEAAGRKHHGHGYHGTALLLPDGRVLAAGPDLTLEVYHPWYTHVENRPVLADVPGQIGYGDSFAVSVSGESDVDRLVLIKTSSVTHSLNTDQRYMELDFEKENNSSELAVEGPESPGIAPPGYYLLFVVDSNDIPSTGKFVQIG